MCDDAAARNPATRYSWGPLAPALFPSFYFFIISFNFDGSSGPIALMLAAEEGCKVRAIHRPVSARSRRVIQVPVWVPNRRKERYLKKIKLLSRCEFFKCFLFFIRLACHMLPTRRFQEENDCGINYFWRRLSQVSPLDWTGWMVISQKIHVFCIQLWEKLPTIYQNSAKRGMLVQDLIPFTLSLWPLFFGHCLLSLFLLSCQVSFASGRATCSFYAWEQLTHMYLGADLGKWGCKRRPGTNLFYSVGSLLHLGKKKTPAMHVLWVPTAWKMQLCTSAGTDRELSCSGNMKQFSWKRSHQDPCSRHMLVMSILTFAPCFCLQIVVSRCSHAGSVAWVHV